MGYAQTTILIFGVAVDEKTAEEIFKSNFSEETGVIDAGTSPDNKIWRKVQPSYRGILPPQNLPISQFNHKPAPYEAEVFHLQLLSDGSDSRIDNLCFDKGHDHFFGLFVGHKGYGCSDDISALNKQVHQNLKFFEDRYALLTKDLKNKFDLSGYPELHIVSQVH